MAAELTELTAVILAGGLGTRLRPVVADRPKALAEIRGRPFLAYLLDELVAARVGEVVLCTGYLGAQLESAFGDSYRNMRLRYSQESSPLGTAGALRLVLPLLKSDPVLVMNGDSFCHTDLEDFRRWHQAKGGKATLLLAQVSDTRRYGKVHLDTDGRVRRFQEKETTEGPGWINAGIYLLAREVLETIAPTVAISLEREVFPALVDRGLYAFTSPGPFLDIGTPEAYAAAELFFAASIFR